MTQMASTLSILDPFKLSSKCNSNFDIYFKTKPFYCSGGNLERFDSLFKYLNMEWEHGNRLYKDKVSKLTVDRFNSIYTGGLYAE